MHAREQSLTLELQDLEQSKERLQNQIHRAMEAADAQLFSHLEAEGNIHDPASVPRLVLNEVCASMPSSEHLEDFSKAIEAVSTPLKTSEAPY